MTRFKVDTWCEDVGFYGDPDGDDDIMFARGPMRVRRPSESYEELKARAVEDARLVAQAPTLRADNARLSAEVERLRGALVAARALHCDGRCSMYPSHPLHWCVICRALDTEGDET